MKITCSACHASYNLPDEKVAGRRVKVRCKRCSEPIVVDGSSLASIPPPPDFEDEATRVMGSPASEAPMWTVNLSDTEQGDMTNEEIVAGWQAGVVTEDAYVWREGMDDWRPILDVPELVSLLSQAMPAEPEPPAPQPEVPAAPTPAPTTPEPPAAALGGPRVPSPPRAAVSPPRVGGADPFLNKPRPKREKPKQDAAEARNENSMLFSLEALKAAAAQSSSDHPPPASLRVEEDLLIMGGRQDPFNAPLIQIEAPVAPAQAAKGASRMPMAVQGVPDTFGAPKSGGKGWLLALGAIVVLGVGGFFAYDAFIAPAAESVPSVATAPEPPPQATPVTTAEAEPPPAEATAAPTASAESEQKEAESARKQQAQPTPPASPDSERSPTTGRGSESTDGKSPSTGSDGQRKEEPEEKPEETPAADAPPFNTDAARSALTAAASKAAACKTSDGPTGSGKVQVTFVNSGRVTSANVVSGPFEGTSVGGCVARTFRQARVPAFSGDAQVVAKSFQIP